MENASNTLAHKPQRTLARRRPALYLPEENLIKLMRLPSPFVIDLPKRQNQGSGAGQLRVVQQGEEPVLEAPRQMAVHVNGELMVQPRVLKHGDIIVLKSLKAVYIDSAGRQLAEVQAEMAPRLAALLHAPPEPPPPDPPVPETPAVDRKARPGATARPPIKTVTLDRDTVIGRAPRSDESRAGIILDHPQLSRSHALVSVKQGALWLKDLNSRLGTFVNGRRIRKPVRLKPDDTIGLGPFCMPLKQHGDEPPQMEVYTRSGDSGVVAHGLTRKVGGNKIILKNVSVSIAPNSFVCLLGGSGAGKTTLLKALCAREPATSGEVWVGGENLYRDFEMLKADIALVPQYDLAYGSLTPRETLRYTARLRLPPDTNDSDVQHQVERVLQSVGLTAEGGSPDGKSVKRAKRLEPAATRINRLSGGQRKRVSLANETVCRPNLLFLDEVTSGLDEETDWKIMRLCRQMADEGITIICVTHTLVNVEEFCDQIVVLAKPGESEPGELVFSGSPKDALRFFGVGKLGDIYRKLEPGKSGTSLAEWQARSLEKGYQQNATPPEPQNADAEERSSLMGNAKTAKMIRAEALRQFLILSRRNLSLLSRDIKTLAIAFAQSLMIAALLILAFEKMDAAEQYSLLFLLGISAFWLGCNNASKEIVKERPIYLQERNVNLSVQAYLAAKVGVSSFLATIQSLILMGTVIAFRDVQGESTSQMVLMVMAALCGSALGLLISSACATRDQANTMVPLALVPQIILGGAIVPVLPELAEHLARVGISQYWIYEGLKKTLGDFEFSRLIVPVGAQLGHMVFFIGAAFAVMYYRDRRG